LTTTFARGFATESRATFPIITRVSGGGVLERILMGTVKVSATPSDLDVEKLAGTVPVIY
jgi:hypothetical protein